MATRVPSGGLHRQSKYYYGHQVCVQQALLEWRSKRKGVIPVFSTEETPTRLNRIFDKLVDLQEKEQMFTGLGTNKKHSTQSSDPHQGRHKTKLG